ncbi:HAD family hydrolase [Acidobacterium sp. S8]|uniref:HAD family hydrolase n=1 Tax=Acidobacterium sp. S8 TaxID=1641854 RepID=UPI00131ECD7D|nr:HAD family hydrolase [Acidobacterium sp. S8]
MPQRKRASIGDSSHTPAFLFDLDGTLIDSVYQHVIAWREALEETGLSLAVWRIHRRIGMSGGLLVQALGREIGRKITKKQAQELQDRHAEVFKRYRGKIEPLPGAPELLAYLSKVNVLYAIATSGTPEGTDKVFQALGLRPEIPVITRRQVERAKPDPDLFLAAAASLNVSIAKAVVVGDSVWDLLAARRAGCLGIGLLSGGYGREELQEAGAYRVYQDPADLLLHLDEVGVRGTD